MVLELMHIDTWSTINANVFLPSISRPKWKNKVVANSTFEDSCI